LRKTNEFPFKNPYKIWEKIINIYIYISQKPLKFEKNPYKIWENVINIPLSKAAKNLRKITKFLSQEPRKIFENH
jgi:hypothetical protein